LVLIVDDDTSFRGLATRLLTSWGYQVVGAAGTVHEALAMAVDRQPSAVLTDISLPDGDGFDLAARLLAVPGSVRVVLTSSDSGAANRQAAQRAGARGFLPKGELSRDALHELLADS
jgi:DNA-binding NarL/FixJ family response regulator